jgi:hypothetical protein
LESTTTGRLRLLWGGESHLLLWSWWLTWYSKGWKQNQNYCKQLCVYRFSFSCPWVTIFLHSRELNLNF